MFSWEVTNRGLKLGKFKDDDNADFSIQESSSVMPHIWLGPIGAKMYLNQQQAQDLISVLQKFVTTGEL